MHVVIGCGNPYRSDDGVGLAVTRRLQTWTTRYPQPGLRIIEAGTHGFEAILHARGASSLTIIDACSSGSEPGTIYQFYGTAWLDHPPAGFSPHEFRWNHALIAGQYLFPDELPPHISTFLIEVAFTGFGPHLSPAVEAAVEKVSSRIKANISESLDGPVAQQFGS